jgi:1-acyl-sn-glycerol-3-phosphate acyltransferase
MNYLFTPFRIAYKFYYFFYVSFALIITYPFFYFLLSDPKRFPHAFKMMRWFSIAWQAFALVPVSVKGRENILSHGSFIICANHTSYMDIPVTYCVFKKYFVFVAKREVESWPLFKIFFTSKMNITVDRESGSGSIDAFKRMIAEIDKGHPLAIYPEGTISRHAPVMGEFKPGAFSIAIRKQIPILPVTFVSNWHRLQRNGKWTALAGPGFSEVVIHEPVFTSGLTKKDTDDLQEKIKDIISKPLKERFAV